jgi:hypothetical protein
MAIFGRKKTQNIELPSYHQGKVIPVLPAKVLLRSPGHQALIDQVRLMSALPNDQFELLYQNFLNNFAEYVQLLPVKATARLGSLLNLSLLYGVNALHYLTENHDNVDSVERYSLFTAAVLYNVEASLIHQRVFITEKGGAHLADWVFSRGSLWDQSAEWYKLFPYRANFVRLRDPVVMLLAKQLLPVEGYDWITSHWSVFVEWLDALSQTGLQGMRFNFILDIIRFDEQDLYLDHLPEVEVEVEESEDTLIADEFFQWLEREIEEDHLRIDEADPDLYLLDDGVFLDSRVVDRFSKYFNSPTTIVWFQIGNALGIAKKSGQDYRFDQFFGQRGKGLLGKGQVNINGLYLSNDFLQVKGRVDPNVRLKGRAPSRDYEVVLGNTVRPDPDAGGRK